MNNLSWWKEKNMVFKKTSEKPKAGAEAPKKAAKPDPSKGLDQSIDPVAVADSANQDLENAKEDLNKLSPQGIHQVAESVENKDGLAKLLSRQNLFAAIQIDGDGEFTDALIDIALNTENLSGMEWMYLGKDCVGTKYEAQFETKFRQALSTAKLNYRTGSALAYSYPSFAEEIERKVPAISFAKKVAALKGFRINGESIFMKIANTTRSFRFTDKSDLIKNVLAETDNDKVAKLIYKALYEAKKYVKKQHVTREAFDESNEELAKLADMETKAKVAENIALPLGEESSLVVQPLLPSVFAKTDVGEISAPGPSKKVDPGESTYMSPWLLQIAPGTPTEIVEVDGKNIEVPKDLAKHVREVIAAIDAAMNDFNRREINKIVEVENGNLIKLTISTGDNQIAIFDLTDTNLAITNTYSNTIVDVAWANQSEVWEVFVKTIIPAVKKEKEEQKKEKVKELARKINWSWNKPGPVPEELKQEFAEVLIITSNEEADTVEITETQNTDAGHISTQIIAKKGDKVLLNKTYKKYSNVLPALTAVISYEKFKERLVNSDGISAKLSIITNTDGNERLKIIYIVPSTKQNFPGVGSIGNINQKGLDEATESALTRLDAYLDANKLEEKLPIPIPEPAPAEATAAAPAAAPEPAPAPEPAAEAAPSELINANRLTSITPEIAKKLVEEANKKNKKVLDLHVLKTLEPKSAEELAKFTGDHLHLRSLQTLEPQSAQELAKFKGKDLYLGGLQTLEPQSAKELAKFKGEYLCLEGLQTLDSKSAEELAKFTGKYLYLRGLQTLDSKSAKELAKFTGDHLYLNSRQTLDSKSAKELDKFKGSIVYGDDTECNFLDKVTSEIARKLVDEANKKNKKMLSLHSLQTLDSESAKELAKFTGDHLSLRALQTLNSQSAKELAKFKGKDLYLNSLQTLNLESAKELANFTGKGLYLAGLQTLDSESAKELAKFKGNYLDLSRLTTLDSATATELANFKGDYLDLSGLTTLDSATATELAKFKGSIVYGVDTEYDFSNNGKNQTRLNMFKVVTPAAALAPAPAPEVTPEPAAAQEPAPEAAPVPVEAQMDPAPVLIDLRNQSSREPASGENKAKTLKEEGNNLFRKTSELPKNQHKTKFEKAKAKYLEAYQTADKNNQWQTSGEALYNLGRSYEELGRYDEALKAFEAAENRFELSRNQKDIQDSKKKIKEMKPHLKNKSEVRKLITPPSIEVNNAEVEATEKAINDLKELLLKKEISVSQAESKLEDINKNLESAFSETKGIEVNFKFRAKRKTIENKITWNKEGFKYEEGTAENNLRDGLIEMRKTIYGEDSWEYMQFVQLDKSQSLVRQALEKTKAERLKAVKSRVSRAGEISTDNVALHENFDNWSEEEIRKYIVQLDGYKTVEDVFVTEFGLTRHEVPEKLAAIISEWDNKDMDIEDIFTFMKGFDRAVGQKKLDAFLASPEYRKFYETEFKTKKQEIINTDWGWTVDNSTPSQERVREELDLPENTADLLRDFDDFKDKYEELRKKQAAKTISETEEKLLVLMHSEILEPAMHLMRATAKLRLPKGGINTQEFSSLEQARRGVSAVQEYHSSGEVLRDKFNVDSGELNAKLADIAAEIKDREITIQDVFNTLGTDNIANIRRIERDVIGTHQYTVMIDALEKLKAANNQPISSKAMKEISSLLGETLTNINDHNGIIGKLKAKKEKQIDLWFKDGAAKFIAEYARLKAKTAADRTPQEKKIFRAMALDVMLPIEDLLQAINTNRSKINEGKLELSEINVDVSETRGFNGNEAEKRGKAKNLAILGLREAFSYSEHEDPETVVGWFANAESDAPVMSLANGERIYLHKGLFNQFYNKGSVVLDILNTPGLYENEAGHKEKVLKRAALVKEINRLMQLGFSQILLQEELKSKDGTDITRAKYQADTYKIDELGDLSKLSDEQKKALQMGYMNDRANKFFNAYEAAKELETQEKQQSGETAIDEALKTAKGVPESVKEDVRRISAGSLYFHWHNPDGSPFDFDNQKLAAGAYTSMNIKLSDNWNMKIVGGLNFQGDKVGPSMGVRFKYYIYQGEDWTVDTEVAAGVSGRSIGAFGTISASYKVTENTKLSLGLSAGAGMSLSLKDFTPGLGITASYDWGDRIINWQKEDFTEDAKAASNLESLEKDVWNNWDAQTFDTKWKAFCALPNLKEILAKIPKEGLTEDEQKQMIVQALGQYIHSLKTYEVYDRMHAGWPVGVTATWMNAWTVALGPAAALCGAIAGLTFQVGDVVIFIPKPSEKARIVAKMAALRMDQKTKASVMARFESVEAGTFEVSASLPKLALNAEGKPTAVRVLRRSEELRLSDLEQPEEKGFNTDNAKWKKAGVALEKAGNDYRLDVKNMGDKDVEIHIDPEISAGIAVVMKNGELFVEGNLTDMIIQRLRVSTPRERESGKESIRDIILITTPETKAGNRDLDFILNSEPEYLVKRLGDDKFTRQRGRNNFDETGETRQENIIFVTEDNNKSNEIAKFAAFRNKFHKAPKEDFDVQRLSTLESESKKMSDVLHTSLVKNQEAELSELDFNTLKDKLDRIVGDKNFEREFRKAANLSDPEKTMKLIIATAAKKNIKLSEKELNFADSYIMHNYFSNILKGVADRANSKEVLDKKDKEILKKRFEKLQKLTKSGYEKAFQKTINSGLQIASSASEMAEEFTQNIYTPLLKKLNSSDELRVSNILDVLPGGLGINEVFISGTVDPSTKAPVLKMAFNLQDMSKANGLDASYGFIKGTTKEYSLSSDSRLERDIAKVFLEIASPTVGNDIEILNSPLARKILGAEVTTTDKETGVERRFNLYKLITEGPGRGGKVKFDAMFNMMNGEEVNRNAMNYFKALLKEIRKSQHEGTTIDIETNDGIVISLDFSATTVTGGAHSRCTNASASVAENGKASIKIPKTAKRNELVQSLLENVREVSDTAVDMVMVEFSVAGGVSGREREKDKPGTHRGKADTPKPTPNGKDDTPAAGGSGVPNLGNDRPDGIPNL